MLAIPHGEPNNEEVIDFRGAEITPTSLLLFVLGGCGGETCTY